MGLARRMRILAYIALGLAVIALVILLSAPARAAATAERCGDGPKFCDFGDAIVTALGQFLLLPAATMAGAAWWIQHRAERGQPTPTLRHAAIALGILFAVWIGVTAADSAEFDRAFEACELPDGLHDWTCIDEKTPMSEIYNPLALLANVSMWLIGILALVRWRG